MEDCCDWSNENHVGACEVDDVADEDLAKEEGWVVEEEGLGVGRGCVADACLELALLVVANTLEKSTSNRSSLPPSVSVAQGLELCCRERGGGSGGWGGREVRLSEVE